MQTAMHMQRPSWLDRLTADPDKAVDSLLRGVAHLPGVQRASPVEAALALVDGLEPEAVEWSLLDQALLRWLQARRQASQALLGRPGGVQRFIRETGEGFRMAWRLELPGSSQWIRDELFDLLRWADAFPQDATFDLGQAVLAAGAHVQQDKELRFLWLRTCEEAAGQRLRHRLDIALLGLTRMPTGSSGGPSPDVIAGLARWASHLPKDDRFKTEVVREWRALKAAFPRQPTFWRQRWQAILDDSRVDHPFLGWLQDGDPVLKAKDRAPKREPLIPRNIPDIIRRFSDDLAKNGLSQSLWLPMKQLLDQIEHFADLTGNSYFLVTSCTNVASTVLPHAPGHALGLARRALLWAPSNGHAWSVRAQALERLGRSDLAQSVLWEGMRRAPSNPVLSHQLALLLSGRDSEAEALLRKALTLQADNEPVHNDLARLLWATGRAEAAIALLRGFLERKENAVILYTLAYLLGAEGRRAEASGVLSDYRRRFGQNTGTATLDRLIQAGPAGQDDMRRHLLTERHSREADRLPVPWDAEAVESVLDAETREAGRLQRIGAVAEADLLFHIKGAEAEAVCRVNAVLAADESDLYAQLVMALAVPEYRLTLEGRTGRFAGSLPLQLALTASDAPAERWHDLAERFPERRPLIGLVRLAHRTADDSDYQALDRWIEEPTRKEDGWETFLKGQVKAHLDGDAPTIDLNTLQHDALTQAVDVGWDASPRAA